MNIIFTNHFKRSYKKLVAKNTELQRVVNEKMLIFEKDQKHPSLKRHQLQGKLRGYEAFSAGYDLRVLYRKSGNNWIFFDLGTHDDVYNLRAFQK